MVFQIRHRILGRRWTLGDVVELTEVYNRAPKPEVATLFLFPLHPLSVLSNVLPCASI
jgi:hypothetical protein